MTNFSETRARAVGWNDDTEKNETHCSGLREVGPQTRQQTILGRCQKIHFAKHTCLYPAVDRADIQTWCTFFGNSEHGNGSTHLLPCYSDAGWRGNRVRRRSMSCGDWVLNKVPTQCGARNQRTIAPSSCESKLYVACSTGRDGLFILQPTSFCDGHPCRMELLDNSQHERW